MIIICPGFHPPQLTQNFISAIGLSHPSDPKCLVIPTNIAPYNGIEIYHWLSQQLNPSPPALSFVGFSAGVVGAIATAWIWQQQGGTVNSLIAVDGWGVPLIGSFPIYRVSHDPFTHLTSGLLGFGQENFYCLPEVSHLQLWQSPDRAWGWWEIKSGCRVRCSAAKMMRDVLVTTNQSSD
ncbi:hypothetical protein PCC7418_3487 [Halothece sp. PCC 7418]|uniref:hypothetical protein n=1 Tax=Halothece sp. (strain PCC 7418) TaxID=65093 RepID=UPI0002A07925|nr:hypothetical protein [Halothece sp. PCC 7418]AFZ45599.1 hypothetical protein PCC7418_3487 [Halothece sp. PCC 7418]